MLLGFLVATASSIVAGAVPLTGSTTLSNFVIAAIPLFGICLNDLAVRGWRATFTRAHEAQRLNIPVPTWSGYFNKVAVRILVRTAVFLVLVYGSLLLPSIQRLYSPGLALLGVLVIYLAFDQIRLGAAEAKFLMRSGKGWTEAFLRSRGTMIGAAMFGVVGWVFIFLLTNAGLGLFGL
jgi:hypothetical protein